MSVHRPRRGSLGYSPRKRAYSEIPHFNSWPEISGEPRLQGFAGYKAGMTHVLLVDYRPTSTTSGQEVQVPVTIIETPPMKVVGIRLYERTPYGLRTFTEIWCDKLDEELAKRTSLPKKRKEAKKIDFDKVEDVRVIAHTLPKNVTGIPKKVPELMEIRIGGGTIEERIKYANLILGKEIDITQYAKDGKMVDVVAVTKGKGWQSAIKRWGVKLLSHKDSKRRRMIGTQGPWNPSYVMREVPQGGQTGYHQRTEYNKRILKIGEKPDEIIPTGGFVNYGIIRNKYLVIHGSVPGTVKRLVRLRDPIRAKGVFVEKPELRYISIASKQG
ncbi:MAG: 50S ribosomal protein L3 [Candidatus Thermoplasmatota archaeon]